jgi:hypothetical protein
MAELIQEWKDNTMQKLKTTHVETDGFLTAWQSLSAL